MRPGGGAAGEELRLGAALLPLRLRLDQAVVDFLQARQAPDGLGGLGLPTLNPPDGESTKKHGLAPGCRCTASIQALMDAAHLFP